ncbi:MAG TPA: SigE family RNA polymerase sigma factor [Marmoricola sp.]|jgi:RNA polymerase sigma-70 factor (sigma-E family)|nr:SigE family RNA polymerase sigma factor [Marmoricola sp.]
MGAAIDADTALEQLHAAHFVRLVRLAVLLLRDEALAEDVVQDCFVEVYRRWDRLDRPGFNAPAYLRQSVVNRSRSALRHRAVVARHAFEEVRTAPGADEPVLATHRRRAVLDALAQLPVRQREVLVLRHYFDLSEREIAETLGIAQGSVKSHASRAAAALRARLDTHLEEDR